MISVIVIIDLLENILNINSHNVRKPVILKKTILQALYLKSFNTQEDYLEWNKLPTIVA